MRKTLPLFAFVIGCTLATLAQAHGLHIDKGHCGFNTPYDVTVDARGIAFDRSDGNPASVFMHAGQLQVDGRDVSVSRADADRLRDYEKQVRALMPELAGIAREGVDIGFSAMTTVAATFAENGEARRELVARLDRDHARALERIDQGIGRGVWKQHDLDDVVEDGLQGAVSELASTVAAGAVKAAFSGDQGRIDALQARAESLDKSIGKEVDARADRLDRRAQALCPRLTALQLLQQQFQFRLADGSSLQLLTREPAHDDAAHAGSGVASR
jgi:hypothetical protein